MMPPSSKDVYALMHGACEYVTLQDRRGFVDMIKLGDLRQGPCD